MLPRPRFSTTRSGCDRQRRASSSTAEVRALPARRAEATDRGARTRTGKRGRRQAIKTELINKLLATTRHSHCTIHSNPVLTRCKYNNYITIQRSSHPIFYTSVNKNAACHLQDAKNIRSSRSTYYQMNVYPSILLKFLPFSPLYSRGEQQKAYQNRKLQSEKCISPQTVAAFRRIYSHTPHFSPHSSDRADLKSLCRGFRLADIRAFAPFPPPAAAATSALSAAFRHFLPALSRKPRAFGDFPSIFAATSARQRNDLVLNPPKPTSRANRSRHDSQQNANNADRRSRTKSSTAAAKRKHRARLNPRRRRGRVAPRGCA